MSATVDQEVGQQVYGSLLMPSFKPQGLWPAAPHTLAKIEIVRRYLVRWFCILGQTGGTRFKRLNYIDGFAGPGEYANSERSSPLAALEAAREALTNAGLGLASKEFTFTFIEKDKEFAENLRRVIDASKWPSQFCPKVLEGTFEERAGQILARFPRTWRRSSADVCLY